MQTLHSLYPSNKGSEFGLKYLVQDGQEIKGARNKLNLFCPDCSKTFKAKPDKIFQGQKPCACGKTYHKTPERKKEKLLEMCLSLPFNFVSVDRPIIGAHDKVDLECRICFLNWSADYSSIVSSGRGCPKCAGQYRYSDEEYIEKVGQVGIANKFKFVAKLDDKKLRQHSHVTLSCNVCEGTWNASLGNILSSKYACPSCAHRGFNPVKRSLLYLLKIVNTSEEVIAYKYGITNNFKRRLENMRLSNSHTIEIVSTWGYEDGKVARIHENSIKKEFKSFLDKSQLPDGHTETIDPDQLMKLYTFQSGQYLSETY